MAGGSTGSSQQSNPFADALKAQTGGSAPTSNPFVQSGMAAMLMARQQPQGGMQAPMRRPMGPGAPMPQMPQQSPQVPFSGAPGQMQGGVGGGMQQQTPWMTQQNPMMGQQSITPSTINPMLARQLGLMG